MTVEAAPEGGLEDEADEAGRDDEEAGREEGAGVEERGAEEEGVLKGFEEEESIVLLAGKLDEGAELAPELAED